MSIEPIRSVGAPATDPEAAIDSRKLAEGDALIGLTQTLPEAAHDNAVAALLHNRIDIHAVSPVHGSLRDDARRMMRPGLTAQIILHRLPDLPLHARTPNMGVNMLLAVPSAQAAPALAILKGLGQDACRIGSVVSGEEGVMLV